MTLDDVCLDPDGLAIRRFITNAVEAQFPDSPVQHAFNDGWPVFVSIVEAKEILRAVQLYQPNIMNPHGQEHKRRAIKAVHTAVQSAQATTSYEMEIGPSEDDDTNPDPPAPI